MASFKIVDTSSDIRVKASSLNAIIIIKSSPPEQSGRYFTDGIFRCIFMNKKFCVLIEISLKFVPRGPINNIPALV